MNEIPEDATTYICPVCGKETIWFECEDYENGDSSTPYYEFGHGPALFQACDCRLTQRQVDSFPVMDMCTSYDGSY